MIILLLHNRYFINQDLLPSHYLGPELQGRTELRTRSCLTRGWPGDTVRGEGLEARMTPAVLHMSL